MRGSEQDFRATLGTDRAQVLLEALGLATTRARQVAAKEGFVEARTEPTVAFDLATGALDGRFDTQPGVRKVSSKGQILWVVDDTYALRVKKLASGYTSSNHPSAQQTAISA